MKRIIVLYCLLCSCSGVFAQILDSATLKNLAVPNSPAFILTDGTFSTVQHPNIPKSFVLGIAQSFQKGGGFPQDYSAEFAPYWWMNGSKRSVFALMGLKTKQDASGAITGIEGEDPFAGLKFTTISMAFLNKDLIPDTIESSHKVVSLGIRSTIVKIHAKNYVTDLQAKLAAWENAAKNDISIEEQEAMAQTDPVKRAAALQKIRESIKASRAKNVVKEINAIMEQKPLFVWDVAAAYATYGVNDSTWKPGRYGIWTTASSYLPLDIGGEKPSKNYLSMNLMLRYLQDYYQSDGKGVVSRNSNVDLGFKLGLEFDKFSIGIESLQRHRNGIADTQNRTVGILNYRLTETLYLSGSFGKNFDGPNRLISQFGINWGFGSEKAGLSQ